MYNNSGYKSMPLAARFKSVLFCWPLGRTENTSWSYLVLRLCNYSAKGGINAVDVALYSQDLRRPRNMLFSMLSHVERHRPTNCNYYGESSCIYRIEYQTNHLKRDSNLVIEGGVKKVKN